MTGKHSTGEIEVTARYPTGIVTLAGLLIGALLGAALYEIPFGIAAGLAVGVLIDSLLNDQVNPHPQHEAGGESGDV